MNGIDSIIAAELAEYGLAGARTELIRITEAITVVRVRGGLPCVLKVFTDEGSAREIGNYRILSSLGVPTLKLYGSTSRSILIEDIEASPVLRLGEERDLSDPAIITALARWYRELHTRGADYVAENGAGMYDEWDMFTEENIDMLGERLGISGEPGFIRLKSDFHILKEAVDSAPRTLCYNDFYYTNMAAARDGSRAMMFDYDLLGKGCAANDIENVVYWFSDEHRELFIKEYGGVDEELIKLQRRVSPVVSLVSALDRGIFPDWAKEALGELLGRAETD